MKLNWNFQRGGGCLGKKVPSMGEVWMFSGTTCTQFYFQLCVASTILNKYSVVAHKFPEPNRQAVVVLILRLCSSGVILQQFFVSILSYLP